MNPSQAVWTLGFLLAAGVVVPLAWPWLDPRFDYLTADAMIHSLRVYALAHTLRQGALFPRWWPDLGLGYGYPLFNYYSPATYYLAMLFVTLGSPISSAVRLAGLVAPLLAAGGSYVLGTVLFHSRLAGLVIAVAFVLSPYPFIDNLYSRGALPEAMALGVLPWLLAATWVAVQSGHVARFVAAALAFAALVLFHNPTALVVAGLLPFWMLAAHLARQPAKVRTGLARGAAVLGLGLALSAFYWMPAIFELSAVYVDSAAPDYLHDYLHYERWLFDPFHESSRLRPGRYPGDPSDPITHGSPFDLHVTYPHTAQGFRGPQKPSLAQAVFLMTSLGAVVVGWFSLRRRSSKGGPGRTRGRSQTTGIGELPPLAPPFLILLGLVLALWFLNTTWSSWVWERVPLLPMIQFPFRLWGPFSLLVACAGTWSLAWLSHRGQPHWVLAAILVGFIAVNALSLAPWSNQLRDTLVAPAWSVLLRGSDAANPSTSCTCTGEFLPRSVVLGPRTADAHPAPYEGLYPSGGWIAGRVWPLEGPLHVTQVWDAPTWTEAAVAVAGPGEATIAFHTLVFPGWHAYVDGRRVPITPAPYDTDAGLAHGFALVTVPPGEHRVQIALGSTLWRTAGFLASLLGVGTVVVLALIYSVPSTSGQTRARAITLVAVAIASVAAFRVATDLYALRWLPRHTLRGHELVMLNLADAVRQNQGVHISSPGGTELGTFVDVRDQKIGTISRQWLYTHPPSAVSTQLFVPPHGVFQAGLGLDPRTWDQPAADGVRFVVEVVDSGGVHRTLVGEPVQPQTQPTDRGWRFMTVDLGPFAGQRVTLTLRTEGLDTPLFDWAGWADPIVYVDRSARAPVPTRVSPAVRRTTADG